MGNIPGYVVVMPVFAVGMGLFWMLYGKRLMASSDRHHAEYRVGELAQRMGLRIVEGNPALNMLQAQTVHNMSNQYQKTGGKLARFVGDKEKETRVRMEGMPYGRPTQFVFYKYTKYEDRIAVNFITHGYELRLSVQIPIEVPSFEIVLRKGGAYGVKAKPEWRLPRQSFADPTLDAKLKLFCADPRLGPHLAPVVGGLTSHRYLHIQGHGTVLSSIATDENATLYVAMDLEQTQHVLEHMATALAGPVQQPQQYAPQEYAPQPAPEPQYSPQPVPQRYAPQEQYGSPGRNGAYGGGAYGQPSQERPYGTYGQYG